MAIRNAAAVLLAASLAAAPLGAQEAGGLDGKLKALQDKVDRLEFQLDQVRKGGDDALWFLRLGDVAEVDKVILTGPPNPRAKERYGIKNERHPQRFHQYVFVPKQLDRSRRHPVIVLPHGGVHGDFSTYHVHLVREMVARGYIVLAPDYRGSTGYGRDFYEAIDYGGLEVDDMVAGRDWAVAELPFVDPKRIAVVGWSHGGLMALLGAFHHPDKFACAYAGVPVSDLLTRLGYHERSYTEEFAAKYHIGKTPTEAVDEYRRRSPIWHVDKLKIPLMVTGASNDRDVNVVEVEQLIAHLKAAGKTFTSKIYADPPGGHGFDRLDTSFARKVRQEMYAFLDRHLK